MKKYYNLEGGVEEVVPNAWSSELSADLLGLIAEKIRSFPLSEFIRFGSVCPEWRSFSVENYQHIKLPDKVPLLLIPPPSPPLLITDNNKKKISSSQSSSSSSSSLCDDDEDEEGEEEHNAGEKDPEEEEPEEELCDDDDDNDREEREEREEEHNAAAAAVSEKNSDEESGKVVTLRVMFKLENYYNPKEIWRGQDHKQRHTSARNFYSLSEKTVYHDFTLHVPYYKNIRGSSHGWLVTVEECYADNGQLYLPVRLFNPFRRTDNNEIQLPPITNGNPGNLDLGGEKIHHSYFLIKAFLSANPSSLSDPTTQLVVLGIYGRYRLAFCRPGDKFWTPLVDLEDYRPVQDLICYNDQFYAILQSGYVFAFVLDAAQPFPTPIVTDAFSPPEEDGYPCKGTPRRYLVESGGDLLQVRRNVGRLTLQESLEEIGLPTPTESGGYITRQFLVFKLDPTGEEWVEMKTLNDHMIFIGDNSSVSISASDFPGGWSRPNSIYYTDEYSEGYFSQPQNGPHDIGVFNLEDGSFERHYEAESKTIMPPPIWIQPML